MDPPISLVPIWHHAWLLQYYWLYSLCCTSHSYWIFCNYPFVLLNPFTFFTQSPDPLAATSSLFVSMSLLQFYLFILFFIFIFFLLFYFYFIFKLFFNIFIDYAITVVPFPPHTLHSILPTPSLPHSPPILHVHGSYL